MVRKFILQSFAKRGSRRHRVSLRKLSRKHPRKQNARCMFCIRFAAAVVLLLFLLIADGASLFVCKLLLGVAGADSGTDSDTDSGTDCGTDNDRQ